MSRSIIKNYKKNSHTTGPLYEKSEIKKFLEYIKNIDIKYYIACLIGINWGLRSSDILNIRFSDLLAGNKNRVYIAQRLIIKEIKTGRKRDILITQHMRKVLYNYLKYLQELENFDIDMFIIYSRRLDKNNKIKAVSRQRLWQVINQAAIDLKLNNNNRLLATHSLRKTYAYQAWKAGARVDELQRQFNHTSPAITHRYACIPDERLDKIFKLVDF